MGKRLSILIALGAAVMIAVATVVPAFSTSVVLTAGPCYGIGYAFYQNAEGGTYESYGNPSCLRYLQYSFNSPDGSGWIIYPPEQAFHDLDHFQSFNAQVQSCHELVYGSTGSGEKCIQGN